MNDIPIGPEQPDRPILANGDSQPEPTLNLNPWCRCGLGPDREGLTHCLYRAADGGDFCLECHHAGVNESPMPCSCDCEFCDPDGDSDLLANQSPDPNTSIQHHTGLAQFFPLEVAVEPPPSADLTSADSGICDQDAESDLLANQSQEPNADLQQGTGPAQFFPFEVTVEPPPATVTRYSLALALRLAANDAS